MPSPTISTRRPHQFFDGAHLVFGQAARDHAVHLRDFPHLLSHRLAVSREQDRFFDPRRA
jgi:hypothetical protein